MVILNRRYKLIIIIIFFLLLNTIFISCSDDINEIQWKIDVEYSFSLTSAGRSYKILNAENPYNTVDEIRIYKIVEGGRSMYSLSDLFKKELIYKTKDKQNIKNIVLAAQEVIREVPGLKHKRSVENYHVVMLDNDKMRAGCFIYCTRQIDDTIYGEIMSYQPGSSFYHNEELLQVFENLKIL